MNKEYNVYHDPISVSGVPKDLVAEFDTKAKYYYGSRSCAIKMMMRAFVNTVRCSWERQTSAERIVDNTDKEIFKPFEFHVINEKDLTNRRM